MKIEYQVIEIKKYGHPVILFKNEKYDAIKKFLEENGDKLVGKKLQIQQASIIKK